MYNKLYIIYMLYINLFIYFFLILLVSEMLLFTLQNQG